MEAQIARLVAAEHPRLLAALARDVRDLELAEECLQDAWTAALRQWPAAGMPARPLGWVLTVARRRAVDALRKRRPVGSPDALETVDPEYEEIPDERLRLLFTCCHPALAPRSQVALALRTLCGLTTEEVARAFLEPPTATAQRIARASGKIRDAGIPWEVPGPAELPARIAAVLASIYLVFNEGYASTTHADFVRGDLCAEAIRLADLVAALLPEPEIVGLGALMKLHDARRPARFVDGALVPLASQDRALWDRGRIRDGLAALDRALGARRPGPYQIQAAIAALHARAPRAEDTDWPQISALYGALLQHLPTPVVELNAAISLAMSAGPAEGLVWLDSLAARGVLDGYHLLPAARADLLERLGRAEDAAAAWRQAVAWATHPAERAHLERRLAAMSRPSRAVRRRRPPTRTRAVPPLPDALWLRVAPWFPEPPRGRGRPPTPDRAALDAIVWVLATGRPWRDLPPRHGPWQTAYARFRAWERDGRLRTALGALDGWAGVRLPEPLTPG